MHANSNISRQQFKNCGEYNPTFLKTAQLAEIFAKEQSLRSSEENAPYYTEPHFSADGKRCLLERRSISIAAGEQLCVGGILKQNAARRFCRQLSVDEASRDVSTCKSQISTTASSAVMTKLRNFRRQLYIHMLESTALSSDLSRALPRDTVRDLYFGEAENTSPRATSTVHPLHSSCLRKNNKPVNVTMDAVRKLIPTTVYGDFLHRRGQTRTSRNRHSHNDVHNQIDQLFRTSSTSGTKSLSISLACDSMCTSHVPRTSRSVTLSRKKYPSDGTYLQTSSITHQENRRMSVQKFKIEKEREDEPPISKQRQSDDFRKNKSASGFQEVEYDESGQTWEIYGMDEDPKALGKAIEEHLEKLMQKMQNKQQNCSVARSVECEDVSGKASSAQIPCKENPSSQRNSNRRAMFHKRSVSHHDAVNVSPTEDAPVSENEHSDNQRHKSRVFTRINRLLHRSFASTTKESSLPDLQHCPSIEGARPTSEILTVPRKCTLASTHSATTGNPDQILVSANS
ncbi:unnamed protein product [Schistocephalus solidus]|uniref:GRIN_C domain-containing protein n=1 Tax=Schistocephalus solidus TaxID=70667 RepID=A0A183TP46_SCHSO|nr:unnamed protein product [Schistocephalus solidus]